VANKQARLAKIREAKAELEAEARGKAAADTAREQAARENDDDMPPRNPSRRRQNRRRSATSPISKAASSRPRMATSRATTRRPRSTRRRRSSWHRRSATAATTRRNSLSARRHQSHIQAQSGRSIGRCRLLLGGQSSHPEPPADLMGSAATCWARKLATIQLPLRQFRQENALH
jgi:hypothetical protein